MVDVRIKPLEWTQTVDGYSGAERREQWGTSTPWGSYYIWYYRFPSEAAVQGPQYKITGPGIEPHHVVEYPSLEAAQVAVQSIHDQHVRSTLSDAVAEREAEPVVWQRQTNNFGWVQVNQDDLEHYRAKDATLRALYTSPPTSELEALRKERDEACADALQVGDQMLAHKFRADNAEARLAEALKALEPANRAADEFLAKADVEKWSEASVVGVMFRIDHLRTARRVREGGNFDE